MLITVLAGILAAFLALIINPFSFKHFGQKAIGQLIPLTEEVLKTGLAWLLGANLLGTHSVFGIIEFFWDLFQPGRGQWLPGFTGFLSHLFFGFITQWIYQMTTNLLLGMIVGTAFHVGFNQLILSIKKN